MNNNFLKRYMNLLLYKVLLANFYFTISICFENLLFIRRNPPCIKTTALWPQPTRHTAKLVGRRGGKVRRITKFYQDKAAKMLNFFTLLNQCKCKLICKSEKHLHNKKNYKLVLKSIGLGRSKVIIGSGKLCSVIHSWSLPSCIKMAKTPTNLDKLVRFLKLQTIFIYSSKLKSKATDIFGMFKFINSRVWH